MNLALEQDADIVIFLYRDKYYDENSEKGDNAEVLIRKHRNGSVGTVELQFVGELTQFRDVEFRDMGPGTIMKTIGRSYIDGAP